MLRIPKLVFASSIIILAAIAASCGTPKPAAVSSVKENQEDSLFASLEKTACYGQCPMYKISIFNSGIAMYEGINFVDNIGVYTAPISNEVISKLKQRASEIDYFDLDDEYESGVDDFPKTVTSINIDGKKKTVSRRKSIGPKRLIQFEKDFESFFTDTQWVLVETE